MGSDSDAGILEKIAELKTAISTVTTTLNSHVDPKNNVTDAELTTAKNELKEAIKQGKDEQKNIWEALMEAVGLKDFFEAFKQKDIYVQITVIIGAVGAVIMGKLLDLGKLFNLGFERISRLVNRGLLRRGTDPGRVLATGESGLPRTMTRQQADSLSAVSINPHGLTPEVINNLQNALNTLTPEIREFNTATRQMLSAGKINGLAKAINNLKGKLNPSPHSTIKNTAKAIGLLSRKLELYDPTKLPKAQDLRNVQSAATNLAETAETLRTKFQALSNGFGTAAGALAGSGA
ncbi:hypothetical protein [Streptomyces sp. CRN 30]|uniref:hypothetical protein n=1 Tax=Streptomyces sp. CRN 30 TaxID=3075613 RepID=UPI002A832F48|nr:hypothetical protein [Streptomyces sp. CRN 30]